MEEFPLMDGLSGLPSTCLMETRRVQFSAAHFLSLDECDDAENTRRFGPSSNTLAHGHNYAVEVAVSGATDSFTGTILNHHLLDGLLQAGIVTPLDFKNLNRQIPFFEKRLTTLENLARYVWRALEVPMAEQGFRLCRVCTIESAELSVNYYGGRPTLTVLDDFGQPSLPQSPMGEQKSMPSSVPAEQPVQPGETPRDWVFLSRRYSFSAGHCVHNPNWDEAENQRVFGRCHRPGGHGHTYELDVTVAGLPDERLGMVTDLFELDQLVQRVLLDKVDYCQLNDVDFLQGVIPTTENVARAIWKTLSPEIPQSAKLERLRLCESRDRCVEMIRSR